MTHFAIVPKGSMYIEAMVAITVLGLIATVILPLYARFLETTIEVSTYSKLAQMTDYVGNYVFRWASFDPAHKAAQLEDYMDGDELELTGERRINSLRWAEPLTASINAVSDHYKTSIRLWETGSRNGSAVAEITVWYDTNLDDIIDSTEKSYTFSTVVTEKLNP